MNISARRQGSDVVTDEALEADTDGEAATKSDVPTSLPLPSKPMKARCIGLFSRKHSAPATESNEDAVHDPYVPPSPSGRVRSWVSNKLNAVKKGKGTRS